MGRARRRTFERRLFGWLAVLAVVPALIVLAGAILVGERSLSLVGTLGPWERVAESGRLLIEAAGNVPNDSALARAAERHREDLSTSLVQANRWSFLEERLSAAAPVLIGGAILTLALAALLLSRRLAHEMASPIEDLVTWAGRLGRGEALPPADDDSDNEPAEIVVLRDALRGAASEIETARRRDLEAERTKAWGEMARRVAHEMKNPLTPLRLAAHRISKQAPDDPALLDAAAVIREETDRLDELARGFAALGRPASGPATEVDLHELLQSLVATDVPAPIRHSVGGTAGTSCVLGRYDELQRAFRNLVRNAVEAVQEKEGAGSIEVGIDADDETVRVAIRDDGPGIPPDLTEAIFEPDRTLKAKGTGLGLAVVRQVTAAHGGSVSARNRDSGHGAEFVVTLPRIPNVVQTP